jgi:hypothetical protein
VSYVRLADLTAFRESRFNPVVQNFCSMRIRMEAIATATLPLCMDQPKRGEECDKGRRIPTFQDNRVDRPT